MHASPKPITSQSWKIIPIPIPPCSVRIFMVKTHQHSSWLVNDPTTKGREKPIWKISQIGLFPQVGVKIKNIWNHLVFHWSGGRNLLVMTHCGRKNAKFITLASIHCFLPCVGWYINLRALYYTQIWGVAIVIYLHLFSIFCFHQIVDTLLQFWTKMG